MSPSLGLKNSLGYVYFGQFLMNIGNTFIFIPVIPELVRCLYKLYDDIEDDIISDISASLFNNAYFLGYLLGPICKFLFKLKSWRNINLVSRIS